MALHPKTGKALRLSEPSQKITDIIDRIVNIKKVGRRFNVCAIHGFDMAFATIGPRTNNKYIIYNPEYINAKAKEANDYHWGVVAIFAHEIGHHFFGHLNGHIDSFTCQSGSLKDMRQSRLDEEDADKFTGYILAHLGASQENSIALMRTLGGKYYNPCASHPTTLRRIESAKSGWQIACKEMGNECNNAALKKSHQPFQTKSSINHNGVPSTSKFFQLMNLANSLKGKRVHQNYCKTYASVSVQQAKRSKHSKCGYSVNINDPASQWSLNWRPQYDWCMKMSSYATQREALYREKKLVQCLQ